MLHFVEGCGSKENPDASKVWVDGKGRHAAICSLTYPVSWYNLLITPPPQILELGAASVRCKVACHLILKCMHDRDILLQGLCTSILPVLPTSLNCYIVR